MKKILKIIVIVFFASFSFKSLISAEVYKCYYDVSVENGSSGSNNEFGSYIEIDPENKEIIPRDKFFTGGSLTGYDVKFLDKIFIEDYNETEYVEKLNGGCPPKVYACLGRNMEYDISYIGVLINGSEIDKIEYGVYWDKDHELYMSQIYEDECAIGILNESKSTANPNHDIEFDCETFDTLFGNLEDNYCKLSEEGCDINKIQEYNRNKTKLKEFCKMKLKNGLSIEIDSCMSECLKLNERIVELEQIVSINSPCGFSGKLIQFIANIVKWVKYIIPVIVIVLGILDFIKAISADKDDEMKKAQGSFVKRLIAAALIFIIPFIIEFILNKMGFTANGCGIIDL